jgi:hypothetical protein
MRKFIGLMTILAIALAVTTPVFAGPDHSASQEVGAAAAQAGAATVQGLKKIAVPFIVVGKTVIDGAAFVILTGAEGTIYIAEEMIYAVKETGKFIVKGAKFVIIKTAQGVRWVAVEALKAGEIIFEAVLDLAELVIEDVVYVLIKVEQGVAFVAKKLVQAGQVVLKGVKYVLRETVEGLIWVTEATWSAIKAGANWTREKWLVADIRTRLHSDMLTGCGAPKSDITFFRNVAADEKNSAKLRKLARAALDACTAFTASYCPETAK